jgi:hypothetical protein
LKTTDNYSNRVKLVFAGDYRQYTDWIRETKTSERDARYIDRIEKVMGMRGAEIVLVGEHWRNPVLQQYEMAYIRALVEV